MTHRKFVQEPRLNGEAPKAPTFTVEGVTRKGEEWSETFTCLPVAPAGVLDDLSSSVSVDDDGVPRVHQMRLLRFFRGVLEDEDVARFNLLVHDKERMLELTMLAEIMNWLTEELVGHPTTPSSTSGRGRRPTGRTSTAAARGKG